MRLVLYVRPLGVGPHYLFDKLVNYKAQTRLLVKEKKNGEMGTVIISPIISAII